jgi:hypothetical protein
MQSLTLLVHGIRTAGEWQSTLEAELKRADPGHRVIKYKYGRFDAVRFFVPFLRQGVLRRLRAFLADLKAARGAGAAPINIVCHSFGTVLVANALAQAVPGERPAVRLLLLCGSVLRSDFNWSALIHRDRSIRHVVNDCGKRDAWPLIALALVPGMGGGGRYGFQGGLGADAGLVNRYVDVDHSGFFDAALMRERWLPLLTDDAALAGAGSEECSDARLARYEAVSELVKVAAYVSILVLIPAYFLLESRVAELERASAEREAARAQREAELERRSRGAERLVAQARQAEAMPTGQQFAMFLAFVAQLLKPTAAGYGLLYDGLLRQRALEPLALPARCGAGHWIGPAMHACATESGGVAVGRLDAQGRVAEVWNLALPAGEAVWDVALDGEAVLTLVNTERAAEARVHARGGVVARFAPPLAIASPFGGHQLIAMRLLAGNEYVLAAYGGDQATRDVRLLRVADGRDITLELPPEDERLVESFLGGRWGDRGFAGIVLARASRAPVFAVASSGAAYVYDAARIGAGAALQPSRIVLDPRDTSQAAALSDDGRTLAVVRAGFEESSLQTWRRPARLSQRGPPLYSPGRRIASPLLLSARIAAANDDIAVTASPFELQVWDFATGEALARIPNAGNVGGLRCEARGEPRCLLSHENGAAAFRIRAATPLLTYEGDFARRGAVALTAAGEVYAAGGSRRLTLGRAAEPEREFHYALPYTERLQPQFFSADGGLLYLGGAENAHGVARIDWRSTPPAVAFEPLAQGEDNVVFSDGSRYVARRYGDAVEVTDLRSGAVRKHVFPGLDAYAVSDDGWLAAVVLGGREGAENLPSLRIVGIEDGAARPLAAGGADFAFISALNFSGPALLVGGVSALHLIDMRSMQATEIALDQFSVIAARLDAGGERAVVIGRPIGRFRPALLEVRVVSLATREELARGRFPLHGPDPVRIDADGRRLRMLVYEGRQLRLARWLWSPQALLAESCRHLQGRFTRETLLKLTAGAGEVTLPCTPPFFAESRQ